MAERVVRFYGTRDEHGYLSNFAAYPLELGGQLWPTSEHYFQAQKFAGSEHEQAIRSAKSPAIAARMGRSRKRPLRADWESVKDEVMLAALRAKFTQHATIRDQLLATGDARIIEHTRNDRYWADGGDGSGKNRLGELLERVRDELRAGLEHARAFRQVMRPGRTFVCFLFGTAVVIQAGSVDAVTAAKQVLSAHGHVRPGTPGGDFAVHHLPDGFGWLVTGDHPDILVRVPPAEAASDLTIGLIGRAARGRDAEVLSVIATLPG